jgi:hypothetical protein
MGLSKRKLVIFSNYLREAVNNIPETCKGIKGVVKLYLYAMMELK